MATDNLDEQERRNKDKVAISIDSDITETISTIVEDKREKGIQSTFSGMCNILLRYGLTYRENKKKIEKLLNKEEDKKS